MDPQPGSAARASSGSSLDRSSRDRRQNPQQQVSQIEKSVTQLLVATKQLLETLTQWSRGTASETQVSDIYVRLGYEFNIACRAFGAIGVETSDLGPVPDLLRSILEETLSQEASQASLDKFLPRIRDIIINLLQGLKKKQQRLRQKNSKDGQLSNGLGRLGSASNLPTDDATAPQAAPRASTQRQNSSDRSIQDGGSSSARGYSLTNRHDSPNRQDINPTFDNELSKTTSSGRDNQDYATTPSSTSVATSNAPKTPVAQARDFYITAQTIPPSFNSELAPPRHRQQDALAALQSGGELERRASRRFSAYQIHKHLGAPTNGIPMIPSAGTPPIPNRGRDTKESMNAVRVRGSNLHGRPRSRNALTSDTSPSRRSTISQKISEENLQGSESQKTEHSPERSTVNNANQIPEDRSRQTVGRTLTDDAPIISATLTSPIHTPMFQSGERYSLTEDDQKMQDVETSIEQVPAQPVSKSEPQHVVEDTLPASKELTLFLQYKSKIKKFVLPGGYDELSVGRLQLAFIEKFAWNAHNNGDLPEIYIQDPVSGVRHELEDLGDVKNRSVLVLNVDVLDEVKRHVDDGLSGIRRVVESVKTAVDDQQSALQRVSDRQQETVKEVARLAAIPASTRSSDMMSSGPVVASTPRGITTAKLSEVQALRRDLAVIRQTSSNFFLEMETSMAGIRAKASAVKSVAVKAALPSFEGDSGRTYVNSGKKTLSEDSEKIVNRVDDLQDVVEDLRKDVVTRGVRPLPRQLEAVSKDISAATAQLKKLQEFLKREKPLWTKIWEIELQVVCDDRDLLTMQEELAADLEDDLEKAAQTFALVEQATKQQNLANATTRSASRNINLFDASVDPQKAKDGVLGEVRALQPNHDTRLEAIERAEKARQRELANRKEGEFGKELGSFVEEGKLKKSGGIEEAERLRRAKDDQIRKEVWERQNPTAASQEPETRESDASPGMKDSKPDEKLEEPRQTDDGGSASPEPEFLEANEEVAGSNSAAETEKTSSSDPPS